MKISAYNSHVGNERKKRRFVRLLCIMLIGMLLGVAWVGLCRDVNALVHLRFTHNIYKTDMGMGFGTQFSRTFAPLAGLLGILYFSGFFAFGQAFEAAALAMRGIATGVSAAMIYLTYGIKGAVVIFLTVSPITVVGAVILALGAGEAWVFSGRMARYAFLAVGEVSPPDVRVYSLKYAVLGVIAAALCAADTGAVMLLGGFIGKFGG